MPILDSPRKMSFHAAQYFSPFYAYSLLEAGGGIRIPMNLIQEVEHVVVSDPQNLA